MTAWGKSLLAWRGKACHPQQASPYTIISLAMLYALWQSSRKDLLDLIRPFVLYAVGNTLKLILLLYVIIWKESWDTNPSKLLS